MRIGGVVFSSGSAVISSTCYVPLCASMDSHVEILSSSIRGLLIIGVYAPDGKETEGTDVLLSILDRAVITGYGTIIVIADPNAKACGLGNPSRSRNKAGRFFDTWLTETDSVFEVVPSPELTYKNQAWHPSWTSYSFTGFISTPSQSLDTIPYPVITMVLKSMLNLKYLRHARILLQG